MGMYQKTLRTYLRASAGDPDALAEITDRALRGLGEYFAGGGDSTITRCMQLPPHTARIQLSKLKRDLWLCRAATYVTAESPWMGSVALAKELKTFLAAIWPGWRDLEKPPHEASHLRICLFEAVRAYPVPESPRQLHNIVSPDIATIDALFDAKARAVIEHHARDDWSDSTSLRDEFTEESYLAYRRAEAEGLITYKFREEKSESNFTDCPAKSFLTTEGGKSNDS